MYKKLKPSSARKPKTTKAIDRPFDASTFRRARDIAAEYRLILEQNDELGFVGSSVEMPTVFADGQTPDGCVTSTREALAVAVATLLESGQRPPLPAASRRRETQINVRLTAEERLRLHDAAKRSGFRGISDFVRFAALERGATA